MNPVSHSAQTAHSAHADPVRESHQQFVAWLRQVAPYIHKFVGQTFVMGIPGEVLESRGRINALVQDLSLLHSIGIRVVIVNGCRPQINEQLRLRGREPQYHEGLRITDQVTLECAKEAAGEIRYDMEALFSQGLPNTPMANAGIRVISGNFTLARPVGIVDGVDFAYSGLVRKVDAASIRTALDNKQIVLLSNIGYSATGEAFNLSMEEVAAATAIALDADKLVFLCEEDGIPDEQGRIQTEISEDTARRLLDAPSLPPTIRPYLRAALRACEGGVTRSHMVPFATDGVVLLEFFLHDGIGTMVVEETLEALREATSDDVGGILAVIQPLEEDGTLVKRDRALIESEIANFTVIEHDEVIFGCAAMYAFPEEKMAEMACLAVSSHSQGKGDGERLMQRIEQRARAAGIKTLFVLTTRTAHWFLKRGFRLGTVDDLPRSRKNLYNWQRRSQVLLKDL
ncbi:MAG: amino-acid N-acetyltransferase [Lautropia sp.]|nr:amino-acid N-acetyltransferase [Lautropia sp.]